MSATDERRAVHTGREHPYPSVVSFARRDGRFAHRNAAAWDAEHAHWHVHPRRGPRASSLHPQWRLDAPAEFGRVAPLVVEIGSGTGDAILAAAAARPEADHLAVEVYRPGLARTVVQAERAGLANLRVVDADGAALLATGLPDASVQELRVFFPDPWHKNRHRKRRLVDETFLAGAARVVRPGGVVRLATDWEDYAVGMLAAARACSSSLSNPHEATGGWAPRFDGRPMTRFEGKGLEKGRVIRDLELVRVPSATQT